MISALINISQNLKTRYSIDDKNLSGLAGKILRRAGINNAEVGIVFLGSKRIRDLNRQYRQIDKATTVLSFSQVTGRPFPNPGGKNFIGEVFICPILARKKGFTIEFLIKHGINNLLSEIPTTKNQRTGAS